MEIDIIQITLVATRVSLHIGVLPDHLDQVTEALQDTGNVEDIHTGSEDWNDDGMVHLIVEVYAFVIPELFASVSFQELTEFFGDNAEGNAVAITPSDDWDHKLIELPSQVLTA